MKRSILAAIACATLATPALPETVDEQGLAERAVLLSFAAGYKDYSLVREGTYFRVVGFGDDKGRSRLSFERATRQFGKKEYWLVFECTGDKASMKLDISDMPDEVSFPLNKAPADYEFWLQIGSERVKFEPLTVIPEDFIYSIWTGKGFSRASMEGALRNLAGAEVDEIVITEVKSGAAFRIPTTGFEKSPIKLFLNACFSSS